MSLHTIHVPTNAPGLVPLSEFPLDVFDKGLLCIARLFFGTLETPESQTWMTAFSEAERRFPAPFGATIAHAIFIAIDALNGPRKRPFSYIDPDDVLADVVLTREEAYLIRTFQAIRTGAESDACTQAMLVCEGGNSDPFLAALERLAILTGEVQTPVFNT